MNARSAAASIALLLTHCGHDPAASVTAPASPVTPVVASTPSVPTAPATASSTTTAAVTAPVSETPAPAPAATAPSPGGEVWSVIEHAGRRWVVLSTELNADDAAGAPAMVDRDEVVVTSSAARPEAVPARYRSLDGRSVLLHGDAGDTCRATLRAPVVLSRVDVHFGEDQRWNGIDDEGNQGPRLSDAVVARDAFAQSEGGYLLAAELTPTGCSGARWAHDESRAVATFRHAAADHSVAREAVAAYRRTAAWRQIQSDYRAQSLESNDGVAHRAMWDEERAAPEVTVWTPGASGRQFVTVRGHVDFNGCGVFSGALWTVFERVDGRLVLRSSTEGSMDFAPTSAVDPDGDGAPDFVSADGIARLGASGYERAVSLIVPSHDCPC